MVDGDVPWWTGRGTSAHGPQAKARTKRQPTQGAEGHATPKRRRTGGDAVEGTGHAAAVSSHPEERVEHAGRSEGEIFMLLQHNSDFRQEFELSIPADLRAPHTHAIASGAWSFVFQAKCLQSGEVCAVKVQVLCRRALPSS